MNKVAALERAFNKVAGDEAVTVCVETLGNEVEVFVFECGKLEVVLHEDGWYMREAL